jgi:3-oxoacyl-[acyl-carrier protein] reductase
LPRPGGRIINISSIAAFTGGSRPGAIGYAAAKAGLLGMTYALARELSPQGITVNAVAPGFIANTEFTGAWSEERIQSIVAQTPVGRAGDANDVAEAVLFLASPEASFITGEVLNVNGGWLFGR